ncbi:MAG: hypothetical protein H6999_02960 [Hahellaceae bacterium]|nr:hypothetical protein [Hahellaceae bacterium]MCP5168704.1 hypothetical protein [Hahellaceae bacterium]
MTDSSIIFITALLASITIVALELNRQSSLVATHPLKERTPPTFHLPSGS